MTIINTQFTIALPEMYLFASTLLLMLFYVTFSFKESFNNIKYIYFLSLFIVISTMVIIIYIGKIYAQTFEGHFIMSPMIYYAKLLFLSASVVFIVFLKNLLTMQRYWKYESFILTLFFILGGLFLLSANSLISLFVNLELVFLTSLIILFMHKKTVNSLEAGIKYFILSALSTGILLYGVSFVYGFTNSILFADITHAFTNVKTNWIVILSLVLILSALAFKLSLAPFHLWTADIYKGTTLVNIVLFAVLLKILVLILLLRLLWVPLLPLIEYWQQILIFLVLLSAIVGFVGIILYTNIKSFLAYSSISNMSYILMAYLTYDINTIPDIFIYLIGYSFTLTGLIISIFLIQKKDTTINNIYDLKGVYKKYPFHSILIALFIISLAGIPPTSGFFGKFLVLKDILYTDYYYIGVIIIFLTIPLVLAYFKIIKVMFFDDLDTTSNLSLIENSTWDMKIILLISAFITAGFIFLLNPLLLFLSGIVVV